MIRLIVVEVMNSGKKPFSSARAVQQWRSRGGLAAGSPGRTAQWRHFYNPASSLESRAGAQEQLLMRAGRIGPVCPEVRLPHWFPQLPGGCSRSFSPSLLSFCGSLECPAPAAASINPGKCPGSSNHWRLVHPPWFTAPPPPVISPETRVSDSVVQMFAGH